MNNMEIINRKNAHNQHNSVLKVLRQLSYYLYVTNPLIIPLIFIFLSCREMACDSKEFTYENSKPRGKS